MERVKHHLEKVGQGGPFEPNHDLIMDESESALNLVPPILEYPEKEQPVYLQEKGFLSQKRSYPVWFGLIFGGVGVGVCSVVLVICVAVFFAEELGITTLRASLWATIRSLVLWLMETPSRSLKPVGSQGVLGDKNVQDLYKHIERLCVRLSTLLRWEKKLAKFEARQQLAASKLTSLEQP